VPITRRAPEAGDVRRLLHLSHSQWVSDRRRINAGTTYGSLAWTGPTRGRTRVFERSDQFVGWARLVPPYDRIRRPGIWDVAPASLVWIVDWGEPGADEVLASIVEWAESRSDGPLVTSHPVADIFVAEQLSTLGYRPDPSEPFSCCMGLRLPAQPLPRPDGYEFTTMETFRDIDLRARVHREAWDGSTRSAADVQATMQQWPYRADLDVIALTARGEPAGSALIWFDTAFEYGEIEPVGVVPGHRGSGVARSLLSYGLQCLAEAGASHAVVGPRADEDYPGPHALYTSMGFRPFSTQQIVVKARPSRPATVFR
jgi:predicted N-acetyltransferase YhbS